MAQVRLQGAPGAINVYSWTRKETGLFKNIDFASKLWWLKQDIKRLPDKIAMAIAWRLPKNVVMCCVRVAAHHTVEVDPHTPAPEVSMMEALRTWH